MADAGNRSSDPFDDLIIVDFSIDEPFGRFPSFFSRMYPNVAPLNAFLIDPVVNVNTIKVEQFGSHYYFTEGWAHFGKFYGITVGAWVRLVYVRTGTFDITIKDYKGIQWIYPPMAEPIDGGAVAGMVDEGNVEQDLMLANNNLFLGKLVKWVSFTEFTSDIMTIPNNFADIYLPNPDVEVSIVDELGNRWPCLLRRGYGTQVGNCVITRGWARFCRNKGFKQCQKISFGVTRTKSYQMHYIPVV